MVKMGRPITKAGRKRVTFYLPPEDMQHLKRLGAKEGLSASEYLHRAIAAIVAREASREAMAKEG